MDPTPTSSVPSAGRSWALGTASAGLLKGAAALTLFVGQIVVVRILGPDGYGEYMYAYVWAMALIPFAALAVQDSAMKFVPQYLSESAFPLLGGYYRFALLLSVAGPIALGAVAAVVTLFLRDRIGDELTATFLVAWLVLTPATIANLYQSMLRGVKRIGWSLFPVDVLRPSITASCVWLAVRHFGMPARPAAAMSITVAAFAAVALLSWFLTYRLVFTRKSTAPYQYQVREWLHVSVNMMGISAVILAMSRADSILLGFWYDKETVGVYVTASQLASSLVTMAMSMSTMIAAPLIAEYHAAGALSQLQHTLRRSAQLTFLAALGAVLVLAVAGRWILVVFFDPAFEAGYPVLLILCFANLCHVVAGPAGFLMTLTGHHSAASRIAAAAGVLCLLLNLAFIPIWGPIGAAIASAVAALIWRTTEIIYVRTMVGVNPSIF